MNLNITDVVFITGDDLGTVLHFKDKHSETTNIPISKVRNNELIKINNNTLINNRQVIRRLENRRVQMMDGSAHKVSRASWKKFTGLPK